MGKILRGTTAQSLFIRIPWTLYERYRQTSLGQTRAEQREAEREARRDLLAQKVTDAESAAIAAGVSPDRYQPYRDATKALSAHDRAAATGIAGQAVGGAAKVGWKITKWWVIFYVALFVMVIGGLITAFSAAWVPLLVLVAGWGARWRKPYRGMTWTGPRSRVRLREYLGELVRAVPRNDDGGVDVAAVWADHRSLAIATITWTPATLVVVWSVLTMSMDMVFPYTTVANLVAGVALAVHLVSHHRGRVAGVTNAATPGQGLI